MLVPVGLCNGLVGDVWLLRVVLGVAVGLVGRSHGRLLVNELGLDGEIARDSLGGGHGGGGVVTARVRRGDGESGSRRE